MALKKKSLMSKYVYPQQGRTIHSLLVISDVLPSLSLAGGSRRRAERPLAEARASGSVEVAREDLFLSAKANSLWRQVGQHTYILT